MDKISVLQAHSTVFSVAPPGLSQSSGQDKLNAMKVPRATECLVVSTQNDRKPGSSLAHSTEDGW